MCSIFHMYFLTAFFFNVKKGLLERSMVISKKKERSLKTKELRVLMCLLHCQGWLVLSHLWCICLLRNDFCGQSCKLLHSTGSKQGSSGCHSPTISSATSCRCAPFPLNILLLLWVHQPLTVSHNDAQKCLFKLEIPPKYILLSEENFTFLTINLPDPSLKWEREGLLIKLFWFDAKVWLHRLDCIVPGLKLLIQGVATSQ